jgi:hypothetical protein
MAALSPDRFQFTSYRALSILWEQLGMRRIRCGSKPGSATGPSVIDN